MMKIKKLIFIKLLFICVLLFYSFDLSVNAKESIEVLDSEKLKESLEKYNTDKVKFCSSEMELINYAYKKLFQEYSGIVVAYDGYLNGKTYGNITNNDLTYIVKKVIEIDHSSTIHDGIGLWGNIGLIKKGVMKFGDFTLLCVSIDYRNTKSEMKVLDDYYEDCLKIIYKDVNMKSLSEFQRCKMVHDFICENFEYDLTLTNYDDYSGVFNLIDGKQEMVCQGYSLMTYKLLTLSGIDSKILLNTDETHSFNIVSIDNKWYFLDTTSDDTGYFNGTYDYNYFLKASLSGGKNYNVKSECLLYQSFDNTMLSKVDYDNKLNNRKNINPYIYNFFYRYLYEYNEVAYIIIFLLLLSSLIIFLMWVNKRANKIEKQRKKYYDNYTNF